MVYFSFFFNLKIVRFVCWTLYNKFWIGNYLSDSFSIQNGQQQGDVSSPLVFNFAFQCVTGKV